MPLHGRDMENSAGLLAVALALALALTERSKRYDAFAISSLGYNASVRRSIPPAPTDTHPVRRSLRRLPHVVSRPRTTVSSYRFQYSRPTDCFSSARHSGCTRAGYGCYPTDAARSTTPRRPGEPPTDARSPSSGHGKHPRESP